jgi:hypothetical protein
MSLQALDEFHTSYAGLGVLAQGAAPVHQVAAQLGRTDARGLRAAEPRYETAAAHPGTTNIARRLMTSLAGLLVGITA